jgi:hypothetical protein
VQVAVVERVRVGGVEHADAPVEREADHVDRVRLGGLPSVDRRSRPSRRAGHRVPSSPRATAPDNLDALWTALHDLRAAEADPPDADRERVLLGYAPTALLVGPALTAATHVRHADGELGAACLDALFLECGEGDAARHRGNLYRALLADHGLSLPDPASPRFIADPRLRDEDFALALVAPRRSPTSDEILPESLGHHAAAIVLGPPPVVRRLAPHARYTADPPHRARALALARRCLAACPAWPRIWRGALQLADARRTWLATLHATTPSAWQAMHDLIARKAPHARGHHRDKLLNHQTLDEWFAAPSALLEQLARSAWVVPGDPDRSPLATTLVEFGGPMFGVFTAEDLAVVRAWILALDAPRPTRAPIIPTTPIPIHSTPPAPRWSAPQLYHRLMRPDPITSASAHDHVARVLRATPDLPHRFPRTHRDLTAWVDARLREQVAGADDPPPDLTRDEVIWMLTQLAPAALVDGAWLQGMAAPALSSTPAAALLLRIYRDELGAGLPRQHHGNVLRATLQTQGVALPPCDSPAFISPRFVPQAFAMPALWLAIAAHSATYLPELLGLNLAIEMAGIGSGYRRAIDLLRRHAIDPYFFVLHNTIDNAASGHTAWSIQAIDLHIDSLALRGDDLAIARAWRRVRRGYLAYDAVSGQLVRALALRLGPRLGLRWLRRRLTTFTTKART